MTEIEQKQLEIIQYYGMGNQLDQLIEECAELIVEIRKVQRNCKLLQLDTCSYFISELADVENLIDQIKLRNKIIDKDVERNVEYKVNRELERIAIRKQGDLL